LTIIDFARINSRDETFDVHGYLEITWKDSRRRRRDKTAAPGSSTQGWHRITPSTGVWTPRLSFLNAHEPVRIANRSDLFSDDEGNLYQGLDFTGKFSTSLNLRHFPFDTQTLQVIVQPVDEDKQELILTPDSAKCDILKGAFLSDWDLGTIRAFSRDDRYRTDGSIYSTVIFETTIFRRSTFYVYRVLLPLTLLIVASWSIFWFDVTQLQPQISTALGIMLSVVVFNFTIDFGLPRAPYLTLIDRHAFLSFAFAFLAIAAVAWLHIQLRHSGQVTAERQQRLLRRLFPIVYVVALTIAYRWA
jgi:hypothetical protein